MSDSEMNLGQNVGVEVVRAGIVQCTNCGNDTAYNLRCEYCGENPQEKE